MVIVILPFYIVMGKACIAAACYVPYGIKDKISVSRFVDPSQLQHIYFKRMENNQFLSVFLLTVPDSLLYLS